MSHISKEYVIWLVDFSKLSNIYWSPSVCQLSDTQTEKTKTWLARDWNQTLPSVPVVILPMGMVFDYTWSGDTKDQREDVAVRKQSQDSEPVS